MAGTVESSPDPSTLANQLVLTRGLYRRNFRFFNIEVDLNILEINSVARSLPPTEIQGFVQAKGQVKLIEKDHILPLAQGCLHRARHFRASLVQEVRLRYQSSGSNDNPLQERIPRYHISIVAISPNSSGKSHQAMSKEPSEPPSYDEVTKLAYAYQDDRAGGQRLIDQLTAVRAEHTRRIAEEKICPSIQSRAEHGLSKSTIVLIPSNLDIARTSDALEIVDFHGQEEEIEQVQLEGNLNRLEFWRQPVVIKELQYVLEDRLSASPILRDFAPKETPVQESTPLSVPSQKRRGFFDRRSSKQAGNTTPKPDPIPVSQPPASTIEVKVTLEDICLRTLTDFGLYETVTQPVVVVKVDING